MTLDVYLAFVLASSVLLFMPGPTILLVVSYALSEGRRSAFSTIFGVVLGDAVAMGLSLIGLGALLRASAELFWLMKTAGAIYLIYLGFKMWRAPALLDEDGRDDPTRKSATDSQMMTHAFTVTVLNPKSGMFFVAFLPQFMDPLRPMLPQTLWLGSTFLVLAFASVTLYALFAAEMRRWVQTPGLARHVNRAGGSALMGAGLLTAALERG